MRLIKIALITALILFNVCLYVQAEEFRWARVKFKCVEPDPQEPWNIEPKIDERFLTHLERFSSLKVDKTWNVVPLDNLEKMSKFPLLFMTASGTPDLSDTELKNLKEYLDRGGTLLADDSHWPEKGGNIFFRGMKKYFDRMYPKLTVKPLPLSHPVLHCFFEIPYGYYFKLYYKEDKSDMSSSGLWALLDEKGRCMVLFSLLVQNTWGGDFSPAHLEESVKIGVNLVIYSMTN